MRTSIIFFAILFFTSILILSVATGPLASASQRGAVRADDARESGGSEHPGDYFERLLEAIASVGSGGQPATQALPFIQVGERVRVDQVWTTQARWIVADTIVQILPGGGVHDGHTYLATRDPYRMTIVVEGSPEFWATRIAQLTGRQVIAVVPPR